MLGQTDIIRIIMNRKVYGIAKKFFNILELYSYGFAYSVIAYQAVFLKKNPNALGKSMNECKEL